MIQPCAGNEGRTGYRKDNSGRPFFMAMDGRYAENSGAFLTATDGGNAEIGRRRPLHEDDPQRRRIRADAGLRQGFFDPPAQIGFHLDLHLVAEIWRSGNVVRSWLLDLTADALQKNPRMTGIAPQVADSGEGRGRVEEAIALGVPAPVITLAPIQRLRSRDTQSFSDKLLAAMRNEFGGHPIVKE
jgi:6-phosphogluconate dehydrogenase (decarboxylating)